MYDIVEGIREFYWYFFIITFIFGASVGSFLNVVIYRLPNEKLSIVKPRSFCMSCKTPIPGYLNIPLLSYVLLRGKCRTCGATFSSRYFFVELMTAIFAVVYLHLTVQMNYFHPPAAIVYFIFTCALIAITFIDIDLQIIPNQISLPGIPIGILCAFLMPHTLLEAVIGAALGAGILLAVAGGYYLIAKKEGMGMGDVKLLAMIGAFLGWQSVPFTLLVSSLVGTVFGILFVVLPGKGRGVRIPFGPFLAMGAVVYIFFGPQLISWYLGR